MFAVHLDPDSIAVFPDKVLWRFDREFVLCRLDGDEGVIADQFGRVDATRDATLACCNNRAVLRTDTEDGLLDLPRWIDGNNSVVRLKRVAREAAADHVHWRRTDELGDEEIGGVVVDFGGRVELLENTLLENSDAVRGLAFFGEPSGNTSVKYGP